MGVKDLWTILDPIAEDISLGYLYGKTVAIDLSAWICDSQAVGQNHRSIQRPDLRNTFFRASRLVLSHIIPVFILEGDAPELKHATIRLRNATQRPQSQQTQDPSRLKKPRSQYQSRLKPMLRLLDAMGLPYMRSDGEAEKLCAVLNKEEVVDAVISQDSDCLLYGANNVLRHFSVAKGTANARIYSITKVREILGLDREQLVVLALLLGCDYCPGGVPGVGREQAVTYLKGLEGSALERIRSWPTDAKLKQLENERVQMTQPRTCSDCWHPGTAHKHAMKGCDVCHTQKGCNAKNSILKKTNEHSKWQLLELQIRNRALQTPGFPSEEIIQEFLDDDLILEKINIKWKQPNAKQLLEISTKLLGWERSDSVQKIMQLVSRWQCQQIICKPASGLPLHPENLLKLRVQQGIQCIEIQWSATTSFHIDAAEITDCTTLEPVTVFEKAYPELYKRFEDDKLAAKKKTKKTTTSKSRKKKVEVCTSCGYEDTKETNKNGHICQFLKKTCSNNGPKPSLLEEIMGEFDLDESVPDHEMSDIVATIVSRGTVKFQQPLNPPLVLKESMLDMSVEELQVEVNKQYKDKNLEHNTRLLNLTSTLADMSIDEKENQSTTYLQYVPPLNKNTFSVQPNESTSQETNSVFDVSFHEDVYDFANMSYNEGNNMPAESTPITSKCKTPRNQFQCKFSLGLDSMLNLEDF